MTTINNENFILSIEHNDSLTNLKMEVLGDIISTSQLPTTYRILKLHLPSILRSKCFNENNYPFSKEVRDTEIGHLFEHILLEYMCLIKTQKGHKRPIHNGLTQWNWQREAKGVFHIQIDSGVEDKAFFVEALTRSIDLTAQIIAQNRHPNESYALVSLPLKKH